MEWISTTDRPIVTCKGGYWEATKDGDKPFMAAISYNDINKPGQTLWWIHHCVIEDRVGLCVVGEDENTPAGWDVLAVEYFYPITEPLNNKNNVD